MALTDSSNFAAELCCQHRNNTVVVPGFSCPNPIPRPFDSDPDPDLASPRTFFGRPQPRAGLSGAEASY
ncbi:MAG: hypothetical protein ACOX52_00995 [Verrucomicrobiota bacterium]